MSQVVVSCPPSLLEAGALFHLGIASMLGPQQWCHRLLHHRIQLVIDAKLMCGISGSHDHIFMTLSHSMFLGLIRWCTELDLGRLNPF